MNLDKHFDVHLIPAFQWASMEDSEVEDREYLNEVVSDIMKGYFKKENEIIGNLKNRIELTETSERSEEATNFFNKCNKGTQTQLTSFDDVSNTYDLESGASWCDHGEVVNETVINSVVSEILLD